MGINILVLTFEYDAFTFSGNGVYAQSLVRGLEMQEGVSVDVVCGGPFGAENCQPPSKAAVVVNLPRWGHLDASCCFREFAAQANARLDEYYETRAWPDLVLGVDWHVLQVYEHLSRKKPLPMVYLNFRVFSRSGPPGASQHGAAFFKAQEFAMMDRSWLTLALSETDAACLRELHPNAEVRVLLPPIRADVMARARRPLKKADVPERHLITCCVRLSDEKEPERFVRLVENLAERKAFDGVFGYKVGLRPVLVTGRCDVDTPLVRRFLDAHPETDVYAFLDAEGLEELYRKSLLHVGARFSHAGVDAVLGAAEAPGQVVGRVVRLEAGHVGRQLREERRHLVAERRRHGVDGAHERRERGVVPAAEVEVFDHARHEDEVEHPIIGWLF